MSYYKKTIRLDGLATTIPVMEWIRDNGCPDLDHTYFIDKYGDVVIVSYMHKEEWGMTREYLELLTAKNDWFEHKGMKRRRECCGWVFLIDGHYYYATT